MRTVLIPSIVALGIVTASPTLASPAADAALDHLDAVADEYRDTFDVYTDVAAAGNHFVHRAQLNDDVAIDDNFSGDVYRGCTAIWNRFTGRGTSYGGFYFQNGILRALDTEPRENWGEFANAGYDLTGARTLSFWVKGRDGGERVEFFAFGIDDGAPFPDSAPKTTTTTCTPNADGCYDTLASPPRWQQLTIDLAGLDLSYVIGGFGWVTNARQNGQRSIVFYLDDIRYDLDNPGQPGFLRSYQTKCALESDEVLRNTAFLYDNALALVGYTAAGRKGRATALADALVYALWHDRFYDDGRLRNAYQAGDLVSPPGWRPNGRANTVRLPGFWDPVADEWVENGEQLGSHTGNMAWAILGLLSYYQRWGGDDYLDAALRLGAWIEASTRDECDAGGYLGGFEGHDPNPVKLKWKSTEHNIDLVAAFRRLCEVTGDHVWLERADHAEGFVASMWNGAGGHFWTGTVPNPSCAVEPPVNDQAIPLDPHTWSALALGDGALTRAAVAYAAVHHLASYDDGDDVFRGFDFNTDQDMPWFEGTAQMVLALLVAGDPERSREFRDELRHAQANADCSDGAGIVAAPCDGLTTGFGWHYFNRLHVGATAWFVFAELGVNPFWMTRVLPPGSDLFADFGADFGLWGWLGDEAWSLLDELSPEVVAVGDLDGDGADDLAVTLGELGLWLRPSGGGWRRLNSQSPARMTTADLDCDGRDELVADFDPGLWIFDDADGWRFLHELGARLLNAGDVDGSGKDDLVVDFGEDGIWVYYDGAVWRRLHTLSAVSITTGDLDGSGADDVVVDLGADGIWVRYDDQRWGRMHTLSAERIVTGNLDCDGADEAVLDLGALGLWIRWNDSAWGKLHRLGAAGLTLADLDGSGKDDVVVDFGNGLGLWTTPDTRSWRRLTTAHSEALAATGAVHTEALDLSYPTTCAEEDNVNVPLEGCGVRRYRITATHPSYEFEDDDCDADFSGCGEARAPRPQLRADDCFADFSNRCYDDGVNAIWVCPQPDWWRGDDCTMTVTTPTGQCSGHRLVWVRKIDDAPSWPQVLVLYADGNLRLKPHPPAGRADVCFGSSVIVGPAPRDPERPFVDIREVTVEPAARTLGVTYRDPNDRDEGLTPAEQVCSTASGGSAKLTLSVDRTRARVDVATGYESCHPFATFRSMWVADGNADVDHVRTAGCDLGISDGWHRQPGDWWLFHRQVLSDHNRSAPDIEVAVDALGAAP